MAKRYTTQEYERLAKGSVQKLREWECTRNDDDEIANVATKGQLAKAVGFGGKKWPNVRHYIWELGVPMSLAMGKGWYIGHPGEQALVLIWLGKTQEALMAMHARGQKALVDSGEWAKVIAYADKMDYDLAGLPKRLGAEAQQLTMLLPSPTEMAMLPEEPA